MKLFFAILTVLLPFGVMNATENGTANCNVDVPVATFELEHADGCVEIITYKMTELYLIEKVSASGKILTCSVGWSDGSCTCTASSCQAAMSCFMSSCGGDVMN